MPVRGPSPHSVFEHDSWGYPGRTTFTFVPGSCTVFSFGSAACSPLPSREERYLYDRSFRHNEWWEVDIVVLSHRMKKKNLFFAPLSFVLMHTRHMSHTRHTSHTIHARRTHDTHDTHGAHTAHTRHTRHTHTLRSHTVAADRLEWSRRAAFRCAIPEEILRAAAAPT